MRAVAALAMSCLLPTGMLSAQQDAERELEAVREQIESLESRLQRQIAARDDGLAELKRTELEIAETRSELASIERRVAAQEAEARRLEAAERQAGQRLAGERDALAQQLRMSFMTGRQEIFKLLLSQESPADLGRMLVYYDYLNRARSERIAVVGAELSELTRLATASEAVRRELESLAAARSRELDRLASARDERRRALAALEASIGAAGDEIEQLRREEARLNELVTELSELLAGFPVDTEAPFGELKGELRWPLEGRIVNDFGELREGGPLRWNGVVLEAQSGALVRAVYHGRVAFADWLPGLGLLLIIDHGDGYMSLYGHNEALLGEPGDWVAPGEPVAQVGDSGGQATPSLYFEIRHRGEPRNPHDWVP